MKSSKIRSITAAILAALMISMTAVACNDETPEEGTSADTTATENQTELPTNGTNDGEQETEGATTPGNSDVTEKPYTVKFLNGEEVVFETKAATGDVVDIPADLESGDPRISFKGWIGLDEADYQAGKVEVFGESLEFKANWYEMFGTPNEYTAKELTEGTITLDGDKDEAYNATTPIDITTAVAGAPGATAKAYLMWDTNYYYLFIEVTDSTYHPFVAGSSIESNDGVEIRMDTLHSYEKTPTYSGGWGGAYRGEPGPMVEAGFKIGAGVAIETGDGFGAGSEAYWEWWSHYLDDEAFYVATAPVCASKATETGYTVEYVIEVIPELTDEAYRPHDGYVIGLGIQVFDKTEESNGTIAIETINAGMNADARKLSNVKLVK